MKKLGATLVIISAMLAAVTISVAPASSAPTPTWHSSTTNGSSQGPTASTTIHSVSCATTSWCVGVGGQTIRDAASAAPKEPVVEVFNGTSWTETVLSFTGGTSGAELASVSCASVGNCVAIGTTGTAAGGRPFVATLALGVWTEQYLPVLSGRAYAAFGASSVSCPTTTDCTLVGVSSTSTTISKTGVLAFGETLASGTWSVSEIAAPANTTAVFMSVSCWAAASCKAAGFSVSATSSSTAFGLIATLSGSTWTVDSLPLATGDAAEEFTAISCLAGPWCAVVGVGVGASLTINALVGTYSSGTWSDTSMSNPFKSTITFLESISCASVGSCTGLGFGFSFSLFAISTPAVVETLSSGTWSLQAAPALDQSDANSSLSSSLTSTSGDVTCPSASSCVVVGAAATNNMVAPSIPAAYTGSSTTWTQADLPVTSGRSDAQFAGIDCVATSHCFAVGTSVDAVGLTHPVLSALGVNGWTSTTLPVSGLQSSTLGAISCATPASCIAVGGYSDEGPNASPNGLLMESRVGTSWSAKRISLGDSWGSLTSISCPAPGWCVAVGSGPDDLYRVTKVGPKWSIGTFTPPGAAPTGRGPSVSCASAGVCVAVGDVVVNGVTKAFTSTLKSGSWHFSYLSLGALTRQYVNSISCTSATRCVAVGQLVNRTAGVIDILNGTTWTARQITLGGGFARPALLTVSCWNGASCVATGTVQRGLTISSFSEQLVNGAWYVGAIPTAPVPEANGVSSLDDEILGLSCRPAGSCVGVGTASTSLERQPYVSRRW